MRDLNLRLTTERAPARRLILLCLLTALALLLPAQSVSAGPATRIQSIHLYADPTNDLVSGLCPPPSQTATTRFLTSDHNMMVVLRFADIGNSRVLITWLGPEGRVFSRDRAVTAKIANPYCSEIGIDDTEVQNININPVGTWTVRVDINGKLARVTHFTVSRPPSA